MKTKDYLILGAAAVGAYLLLQPKEQTNNNEFFPILPDFNPVISIPDIWNVFKIDTNWLSPVWRW
jgi:hypothetical protein